jgi:predicted RNA binding protein YcfA (HicA-like mRNA interferase family)
MGKWKPCKRRDFIRKLKKFGFQPPEPGGHHFYMRYGTYTLTLPKNKEYSVPQLKMLLGEIERGTRKKVSLEEWGNL